MILITFLTARLTALNNNTANVVNSFSASTPNFAKTAVARNDVI